MNVGSISSNSSRATVTTTTIVATWRLSPWSQNSYSPSPMVFDSHSPSIIQPALSSLVSFIDSPTLLHLTFHSTTMISTYFSVKSLVSHSASSHHSISPTNPPYLLRGCKRCLNGLKLLWHLSFVPILNTSNTLTCSSSVVISLCLKNSTLQIGKQDCNGVNSIAFSMTLSFALSKLRKVNLSCHYYIDDQLLFHLFKNCMFLKEVILLALLLLSARDQHWHLYPFPYIQARHRLALLNVLMTPWWVWRVWLVLYCRIWLSQMSSSPLLQGTVFLWQGFPSKIATAIVILESFLYYPSVNVYNIWIFKRLSFWMIIMLFSYLRTLMIWCQ